MEIPDEILKHESMSCPAFRVLIHALSLPKDFKFSSEYFVFNFKGIIGKDSLLKSFRELEELGYLKRENNKERGRYHGSTWQFYAFSRCN